MFIFMTEQEEQIYAFLKAHKYWENGYWMNILLGQHYPFWNLNPDAIPPIRLYIYFS